MTHYIGEQVWVRLGGKLTQATVTSHVQSGRNRGKWLLRNPATGRSLTRTTRQLELARTEHAYADMRDS